MQLHTIKRHNSQKAKRYIGRGGKRGTTAGRGTKGQKARAGHKIRPELRDIIKKLPKLRGRGKNINTSVQIKPTVLRLGALGRTFPAGAVISPKTLLGKRLVKRVAGRVPAIKLLAGSGPLSVALVIEHCQVSAPARQAIEAAGGTIK